MVLWLWELTFTGHADSFMDVPRLSTLQALMILLKARESAPKKGYYYRSYTSITQCVSLGKDLGLDEHYAEHQAGRPCSGNLSECALKTRIWQTLFLVELMIASPQGRFYGHGAEILYMCTQLTVGRPNRISG